MTLAARPAQMGALDAVAHRARQWLCEAALPLWSGAGFDAEAGMFHEQLAFDATPRRDVPRRLMVQARQVSVFARAALEDGFPGAADIARVAGRSMIARYLRADGAPGWVFSLGPDGQVASPVRDLYAHAFVLYGLAWLRRLGAEAERQAEVDAAIAQTLAVLDAAFRDPRAGGFWDRLPAGGSRRSQNPHMHLFEALIALYEATGDGALLERCRALDALARTHFLSADGGWLREDFTADWSVVPHDGAGRVEPGHMFEWAFLFLRYEAVSGEDRSRLARSLIENAMACGLDRAHGRIIDEVAEGGARRKTSSRCWPHAEALKALAGEMGRGRADHAAPVAAIAERLLALYCPAELGGGWRDQMDEVDRPVSAVMPASTLYHVHGGFTALLEAARHGRP